MNIIAQDPDPNERPKTFLIAIWRPRRRTLGDRLRRREPSSEMHWGRCPKCDERAEGGDPVIDDYSESNRSFSRSWSVLRGIKVKPCGHMVNHFVVVLEGHEDLLVQEVLRYERGEA